MQVRWRLRMAAAQREVWTGAQLRRLLAERAGLELSSASVSALFSKQPAQVKLDTLAAILHDARRHGQTNGEEKGRTQGRPGTDHATAVSPYRTCLDCPAPVKFARRERCHACHRRAEVATASTPLCAL